MKYSENRDAFIDGENIPQKDLPRISDNDTIEDMFRQEQYQNQNDVKEIFGEHKVKARTDISGRQIKLVTKAFYLAEITGMKEIHQILNDFLLLSISKDRKSRLEYVEGLKARIEQGLQQSANMRGQFGKG